MKVSTLIELRQKCSPDGDVTVSYGEDNPLDGNELNDVLEIVFHKDGFSNTVVLKA